MEKQEILSKFPKQEEKLLVAKIIDKLKYVHSRNEIQTTNFLDEYEQKIVTKVIQISKEKNYLLDGGYEEAQRKMLFLYPDKLQNI